MLILYRIFSLGILLGIVVIVHEFGHYIAARLSGVRVEVFSFGFGKRLLGKKFGDTDFRLSLIPFGGYVRMAGEDDYEKSEPKPDEFLSKNRAQKIFILAMGPIMNLVLALVVLTGVYMSGISVEEYQTMPPIIGFVSNNSPAFLAGIKKGDKILKINNKKVSNWRAVEWAVNANPNEEVELTILRNGKALKLKMKVEEYNQMGYSGMFYDFKTEIDSVINGGAAEKAGLKKGDIIIAINDKFVNYYNMGKELLAGTGQKLNIGIIRDGKEKHLTIIPRPIKGADLKTSILDWKIGIKKNEAGNYINAVNLKYDGIIGIMRTIHSPNTIIKISLSESLAKAGKELTEMSFMVINTMKKMISGTMSAKNLSGPIEIARVSQEVMESGMKNFFMLIAFISLQLGLLNLFPIPALDGGHLLIYSIEIIIRRDLPPKIKNFLMNIGFLLLMLLMIFVILNDVAKNLPNGWNSFLP